MTFEHDGEFLTLRFSWFRAVPFFAVALFVVVMSTPASVANESVVPALFGMVVLVVLGLWGLNRTEVVANASGLVAHARPIPWPLLDVVLRRADIHAFMVNTNKSDRRWNAQYLEYAPDTYELVALHRGGEDVLVSGHPDYEELAEARTLLNAHFGFVDEPLIPPTRV